jgi:hypothetical protein
MPWVVNGLDNFHQPDPTICSQFTHSTVGSGYPLTAGGARFPAAGRPGPSAAAQR